MGSFWRHLKNLDNDQGRWCHFDWPLGIVFESMLVDLWGHVGFKIDLRSILQILAGSMTLWILLKVDLGTSNKYILLESMLGRFWSPREVQHRLTNGDMVFTKASGLQVGRLLMEF